MKRENTATRLKSIMNERNLRQVDILEKCKPFCEQLGIKLGRNDLSQYISGKVEPRQDKLTVLGHALNVSEAWLMGYDVPVERSENIKVTEKPPQIITFFNRLNSYGKEIATEQVRLLTLDEKYTAPDNIIPIEKEPVPEHLVVQAAHNDSVIDDEELAKMQRDMELLKKYRK